MRWLIPLVLAGAVVAVYGLIFTGVLDRGNTTGTTAASLAASPTAEEPTATTAGEANEQPSTTAAPATTTSAPTTTTTLPAPTRTSFAAVGDPVAQNQLTLKASSIGPIELGTPAAESVGRLVASLGTPDAAGIADEQVGLCPNEAGLWVRWGELTAIVSGTPEDGVFASYRYEEPDTPASHIDLRTLSGLRLGDSVADLERIYASYTLSYQLIDGSNHFRLLEGDQLLLWGPLTSTEQSGRILGIYAPSSCVS